MWDYLMPTSPIRNGDHVTWIAGWIFKGKSRSMDHNDFWTNRLHLLLDHCASPWVHRFYIPLDSLITLATPRSSYIDYNDSWTKRVHLCLDH